MDYWMLLSREKYGVSIRQPVLPIIPVEESGSSLDSEKAGRN
jgi:hypothetical protein